MEVRDFTNTLNRSDAHGIQITHTIQADASGAQIHPCVKF